MKWIIIIAIVILAPTFVINTVTGGVSFISTHGRAFFTEVTREVSKTVQEAQ